jgi:hypothetical protein
VGFYVRILTPSRARITAAAVRKMLKPVPNVSVRFSHQAKRWEQAFVSPRKAPKSGVLTIERNTVTKRDALAAEELAELDAELKTALPRSGAKWVRAFLKTVKTIYAVQLHAAATENGAAVEAIVEGLRVATRGIVQADGNGFSNHDGDLVVWQFPEHAQGEWTMAVLRSGVWQRFTMEVSDRRARHQFLGGSVPRLSESRHAR